MVLRPTEDKLPTSGLGNGNCTRNRQHNSISREIDERLLVFLGVNAEEVFLTDILRSDEEGVEPRFRVLVINVLSKMMNFALKMMNLCIENDGF